MHIPVTTQTALMGEFVAGEGGAPRDFEDESEVEQALCVSGEGSGEAGGEGGVSSRGNGGAIRDRQAAVKVIPCPRCQSMNTKFCYYNNYSVNQPRHFCRNCQRYWTVGGTLRNVPVGGGSRKKTRTRGRNDAYHARDVPPASSPGMMGLLSGSSCIQQLAMLPSTLGGIGISGLGMASFPNLFLAGFAPSGTPSLFPPMPPPKSSPISGIQEVPELQASYDVPQAPAANSAPMMMPSTGFFLPDLQSGRDALVSVMAKASLWSSPAQQLQALTGGRAPSSSAWEDRLLVEKANSLSSQPLSHLSGYAPTRIDPIGAAAINSKLAPLHDGFWEAALLHSRPGLNDRLVPHVTSNSWEDPNSTNFSPTSTNFSPNSSTTEERCPPSSRFGYHEDAASQPWVGLQGSDILQF